MGPILIVNPNSSVEVTDGIARTVAAIAPAQGPAFEVTDLPDAPTTIASEADTAAAGQGFVDCIRWRPDASAFVTACFSDPGLAAGREAVAQPVIGIQEAGVMAAMARADLFGIVALSPASVSRHRRQLRAMGADGRLAGELALPGVSAAASGRDPQVYIQLRTIAEQLGEMGAGAIVLGCAGMAPIRRRLERDTGLAVVDPVLAAAALALAAVADAEA